MLPFIARRTALMVPVLLAISLLSFIIIELPPGDYFSYYIERLYAQGEVVDEALIESMRLQYGVDAPLLVQYLKWLSKIVRGDLGRSLSGELVIVIVRERLPWSVLITAVSFVFVHVVGIPIGVLSATKQYSIRDYVATFIGFIGLAVPNFLLALVLVWWAWFAWTGQVQIGLFSREYAMAPWSLARMWDLLKHLIIPAVVIGTAAPPARSAASAPTCWTSCRRRTSPWPARRGCRRRGCCTSTRSGSRSTRGPAPSAGCSPAW